MIHSDNYDLKPKRKFLAAEVGQLIFSVICLICTGYLLRQKTCSSLEIFNYILFFGSLIFVIYLLITLVVQFKDKGTNNLLGIVDWVFIAFHLIMFTWAIYLYYSDGWESCTQDWGFWLLIYVVFGFIAFFFLICVLFMGMLRLMGRKSYQKRNPDHKFVKNDASFIEFDNSRITGPKEDSGLYDYHEYKR